MTEGEDMAPSKPRRSIWDRDTYVALEVLSSALLEVRNNEPSLDEVDSLDAKKSRRGGDDSDSEDSGSGKGKGSGNGGGGGGGGDKNKGNNKSQDDGSKDSGSNNHKDGGNTNNNKGNGQDDSTTISVVTATIATEVAPPPAPLTTTSTTPSPLPIAATTTSSTTSSFSSVTTPVATVIQSTSVVTSVQMATMTTIVPVLTTLPATLPPLTISSQPRKGVDGPGEDFTPALPALGTSSSLGTIAFTATDATATVTATALADTQGDSDGNGNSGSGSSHNGGKDRDNDKPPPGALDPAAEHALIAVGSIGAFVLICFVGWIIYRTLKKSRRRREEFGGNNNLMNRLPWRRNQADSAWDNQSMFMRNEMPPPMYEKGNNHNSMEAAGFYNGEKMYKQQQQQSSQPPRLSRTNTANSQRTLQPQLAVQSQLAPGSVVMIPAEQYMAMSQAQSPIDSDINNTMRSRMPDAFFNQSELARQPSNAYDPAQRQVYRASELSSLSSGFGDGDIIIPEEYLNAPPPAATQLRQSNNLITRFSWMARREAGDRETVYTTTSEDRPARYRSVGSWVNQQTGRLKRADERSQEAPPPVPDIPQLPTNNNDQGGMR
ncbi:hypothetical protein KJ359_012514 [Pestalotiopsis sp. 9143b]|nr:hypothetical protein KJ359_012514 [Pestalotiopsis sp. 9143b]